MTNHLDRLLDQHGEPQAFALAYVEHLAEVMRDIDFDAVAEVVRIFLQAREEGRRIFFLGNGGSASTASHFAIDIGVGTRSGSRPFRALSITDNNAVLTGLANDEGYDRVFARQLEIHMEAGDVVVAISASGNSPNVLRAVELAKERGNHTIGLVGFDGGELARMCDTVVLVPTDKGEYGPVEDAHLVIDHIVTAYLTHLIASEAVAAR